MNRDGRGAVGEGMRPLTKQEIDRRIGDLVAEGDLRLFEQLGCLLAPTTNALGLQSAANTF